MYAHTQALLSRTLTLLFSQFFSFFSGSNVDFSRLPFVSERADAHALALATADEQFRALDLMNTHDEIHDEVMAG